MFTNYRQNNLRRKVQSMRNISHAISTKELTANDENVQLCLCEIPFILLACEITPVNYAFLILCKEGRSILSNFFSKIMNVTDKAELHKIT